MDFVYGDVVAVVVARVGFAADLGADVHLRGESDDAYSYPIFDACFDCIVDVSRITSEQSTYHDHDFSGTVGRRVVECRTCHLEGVLEGRISFRIGTAQSFDGGDVLVRIAGHVAHADGDAVSHSEDAEL